MPHSPVADHSPRPSLAHGPRHHGSRRHGRVRCRPLLSSSVLRGPYPRRAVDPARRVSGVVVAAPAVASPVISGCGGGRLCRSVVLGRCYRGLYPAWDAGCSTVACRSAVILCQPRWWRRPSSLCRSCRGRPVDALSSLQQPNTAFSHQLVHRTASSRGKPSCLTTHQTSSHTTTGTNLRATSAPPVHATTRDLTPQSVTRARTRPA